MGTIVRLLIDTNIFLEVLLNQAKAEEAKALLAAAGEHDCFISDFALHSIGLLLVRQGKPAVLRQFVTDIVLNAGVQVVSLAAADFDQVIDAVLRFRKESRARELEALTSPEVRAAVEESGV